MPVFRYSPPEKRISVKKDDWETTFLCDFCENFSIWVISSHKSGSEAHFCDQCLADFISEAARQFYFQQEVLERAERAKKNAANHV